MLNKHKKYTFHFLLPPFNCNIVWIFITDIVVCTPCLLVSIVNGIFTERLETDYCYIISRKHFSRFSHTGPPQARPIPSLHYPILIPVPPPHHDLTIHRLLRSNSLSVANAVLFFTHNRVAAYAIIIHNDK
jgi:hypothetical protein